MWSKRIPNCFSQRAEKDQCHLDQKTIKSQCIQSDNWEQSNNGEIRFWDLLSLLINMLLDHVSTTKELGHFP